MAEIHFKGGELDGLTLAGSAVWNSHAGSGEDIAPLGSSGNRTTRSRPAGAAFERHYRIGELAEMWRLGRETVRVLVKDEDGVVKGPPRMQEGPDSLLRPGIGGDANPHAAAE